VASLADVRAQFAPAPGVVYLDAATYGLPPRATVAALQQALLDWQQGTADWRDWDAQGDAARTDFAALVGADPRCVALMPSVSAGVGTVAGVLRPGDEVVVPDDDFRSVVFPLLVRERAGGARVRPVPFDRLVDAITPATRMVAFSLVQSHSGRCAPLARVCEAARAVGAQVLVDATHALPFVSVSASLPAIDYLVCAAYKHLLCPRGVALLHVAERRWDEVPPVFANWRSAPDPHASYYGGPLDLAPDAARFDVSLAWHPWVGASVSLRLLRDWQQAGLLAEVNGLARRLAERLGLEPPEGSVLSVPVADAEAARAALAAAGIRASVRVGAVRLSPHVYNTADEIDQATAVLAPYTATPLAAAGAAR
jgi:selenocysteine lyase/cysteine desulfurase